MVCCVQQEYEAEQEYIKTLSYLSAEEQRKYKERQSVSFMYQKPPGMDSGVAKAKVCTAWDQIDIQGNKRCTVLPEGSCLQHNTYKPLLSGLRCHIPLCLFPSLTITRIILDHSSTAVSFWTKHTLT